MRRTIANPKSRPFWTLVLALACLANGANASPETREYAAELLTHEARQTRAPDHVLLYGEAPRLRALLDERTVRPLVEQSAVEILNNNNSEPDLTKLLAPLLARYEKAFKAEPKKYEAEYIDAVAVSEITLRDRSKSRAPMQFAAPPRQLTEQDKKMLEALTQLTEGVSGLIRAVRKRTAKDLRQKVADGTFSPGNIKRVNAIATRFDD